MYGISHALCLGPARHGDGVELPTDRADLSIWLDGSDPSSFEMSGPDIDRWVDKSNLNNHAGAYTVDSPSKPQRSADGSGVTFPSGSGLVLENATSINLGTPSIVIHLVRFVPGSDTETRILYEEGGLANGLSVLTSGGRIWNNMWSGAPTGNSPYFVDMVDQAPVTVGASMSVAMIWNKNEKKRYLYLNDVLTHAQTVDSEWPAHVGDVRIGRTGDIFYPPSVTPPVSAQASFDGILQEVIRWQS